MSYHYTDYAINQLTKIFNYMDADCSGNLDKKEFQKFVMALGTRMPKKAAKNYIKDTTGGLSKLDFESFCEVLWVNYLVDAATSAELNDIFDGICQTWGLGSPPPIHPSFTDDQCEQLALVYNALDRDGSGSLDKKELTKFVKALGTLGNREATRTALDAIKQLYGEELDFIAFLDFFYDSYGYHYADDWDEFAKLIDWVESQITGGNYFATDY
jgi:Ca2+-binding EF-hand superfamily protein